MGRKAEFLMTQWDYVKEGGNTYPVQPGDIWEVGKHVIMCGDLERGDGNHLLSRAGAPDLVYVDPPWNAGNARSFRTKSGLDGEQGRAVDFPLLLELIVAVAAHTKGAAFIEMGRQQIQRLHETVVMAQGKVVSEWGITYYGKKPCMLLMASWSNVPAPEDTPEGLDDEHTPKWAIERFTEKGDLVLDACTGRGLTAQTSTQLGRRFAGMELHPKRVSVTLAKLCETTGEQPHKTGILPGYGE